MSFALFYVLINYFIFSLFVLCLFCFLFCVFSVFVLFYVLFLPTYIVVYFLYCCLFPTCVQFHRPLPPVGNPIEVNKYHIYSTTCIAISHYRFISYNLKLSHLRNVCNTQVKSFLQNSMVCTVCMVIRHLPSPLWSQWCFSCHRTVNGRFMFRELPSSCSAFCEDAGITNFLRVSNNTGFQNPAVSPPP